jgi:Cof subfamily protein (haloacid dehalogenase superfamily)
MKTFVFDLDDTLLNREKRIGENTRKALIEAAKTGSKIIFATSRPERAVNRFIDEELLTLATLITLNGAILRESPTQISRYSKLGNKAIKLIEHKELSRLVHFSVEFDGHEFASNANYTDHELDAIQSATRDMVIQLANMEIDNISKVAVDGLGNNIEGYCDYISTLGMKAIPSMNGTFLNVVDPTVDKSSTLRILLNRLSIPKQDVVVFGDDIPDIEMLKVGGLAVAMSNAKQEVKAIADVIIGDCDNDEIGDFIRQYGQ